MHQRGLGFAENASSASWVSSSSSNTVDLKYPYNMLDITSDQSILVSSFVSEPDEQNQVENTTNFNDLSQTEIAPVPEQISLPENQIICYLKDGTLTRSPSFSLYPLEIQFIPILNLVSRSELETNQDQTMIIENNAQCAIATVSKLHDHNRPKVKDEEDYVKFKEKNTLNTRKSRERKRVRGAILKEQLLALEREHKKLLQQLTKAMKERQELMERLTEAKNQHEELIQRVIEAEGQAELQ